MRNPWLLSLFLIYYRICWTRKYLPNSRRIFLGKFVMFVTGNYFFLSEVRSRSVNDPLMKQCHFEGHDYSSKFELYKISPSFHPHFRIQFFGGTKVIIRNKNTKLWLKEWFLVMLFFFSYQKSALKKFLKKKMRNFCNFFQTLLMVATSALLTTYD